MNLVAFYLPDVRVEAFTTQIHWTHDDPGFSRPAAKLTPLTDRGRLLIARHLLNTRDWDRDETYRHTFGVNPRHAIGVTGAEISTSLLSVLLSDDNRPLTLVQMATPAEWVTFETWLESKKRPAAEAPASGQ